MKSTPSPASLADTTVARSMVFPIRSSTAPSACLASLPVSRVISRPSGRVMVFLTGLSITDLFNFFSNCDKSRKVNKKNPNYLIPSPLFCHPLKIQYQTCRKQGLGNLYRNKIPVYRKRFLPVSSPSPSCKMSHADSADTQISRRFCRFPADLLEKGLADYTDYADSHPAGNQWNRLQSEASALICGIR